MKANLNMVILTQQYRYEANEHSQKGQQTFFREKGLK